MVSIEIYMYFYIQAKIIVTKNCNFWTALFLFVSIF